MSSIAYKMLLGIVACIIGINYASIMQDLSSIRSVKITWRERLPRTQYHIIQTSLYNKLSNYEVTSMTLQHIHNISELVFDIEISSTLLPYYYMTLMRIWYVDNDDLVEVWDHNMNEMHALSWKNELKVLKLTHTRLQEMCRAECADVISAVQAILLIIDTVCSESDATDVMTMSLNNTIESLFSKGLLEADVKSSYAFGHYVNNTLLELSSRSPCADSSSTSQYIFVKSPADIRSPSGNPTRLAVKDTPSRCIGGSGKVGHQRKCVKRTLHSEVLRHDSSIVAESVTFSTLDMECSTNSTKSTLEFYQGVESDVEVLGSLKEQPEICWPVLVNMRHNYNVAIASAAMMLSSMAYATGGSSRRGAELEDISDKESNRINLISKDIKSPRVLSLGLGGGELHSFLLRYHPYMTVHSVEISSDIAVIAQQHFNLSVCSVNHIGSSKSEDFTMSESNEGFCRSKVIIGDLAEALLTIVNNGHLYDYIISDVFDLTVAQWDGRTYSGHSNPGNILNVFQLAKDVLNPEVGLAIFHLHKDELYLDMLQKMRVVFADVVQIAVTDNSALLVGSPVNPLRFNFPPVEKYLNYTNLSSNRLCDDINTASLAVEAYGEYFGYSPFIRSAYRYAFNCLS